MAINYGPQNRSENKGKLAAEASARRCRRQEKPTKPPTNYLRHGLPQRENECGNAAENRVVLKNVIGGRFRENSFHVVTLATALTVRSYEYDAATLTLCSAASCPPFQRRNPLTRLRCPNDGG